MLTIDAPEAQRRLLENYLDLSRLAVLAPGETLSESELRRLEAATPAQARSLLATQGYMQAEVRVQREPGAAGEVPRVHISVTPGAQTRVTQADIALHGPLADAAAAGDARSRDTLAAWHKAWRLPLGSAFTDSAWREAKNAALTKLRADGYASAAWTATGAEVDADRASAQVHVAAESGPLFRTGALVIEGLARQEDSSARNLANFEPGTPATEVLLLDYQERLQRSGLFERVVVTPSTDPAEADAAPVTVRLSEVPLQQTTIGVGISANNGPRVSLEHIHRHIFGEPATMRNKFEIADRRRAWEGELSTHTLPGLYRNLVGGTAERLDSDTDRAYSLRFRAGRAYDNRRADRILFVEVERGYVEELVPGALAASANPDTLALTLNFHATWRNVDSIVLPTLGQSLALQLGGWPRAQQCRRRRQRQLLAPVWPAAGMAPARRRLVWPGPARTRRGLRARLRRRARIAALSRWRRRLGARLRLPLVDADGRRRRRRRPRGRHRQPRGGAPDQRQVADRLVGRVHRRRPRRPDLAGMDTCMERRPGRALAQRGRPAARRRGLRRRGQAVAAAPVGRHCVLSR